jgi:glycosyltransferase involved in cell wall biosynthesis
MNNLPLVSIALCTYNGEKFLAKQLDTLINQTYKNLEIIAVDDCSTDETYAILESCAARYPHLHIYRNKKNLSFSKNFELALSYCKGDFIAICDQDDLWHPQKIELQFNAIGDHILIYHDSEFIDEDDQPMGKKVSDIINLYRGDNPEVFLFSNCVSGHTIFMRRELLKHAGSFDGYFHDWWLAYVATNIRSIDFLPKCLVQYRQHLKSDTDMLSMKESDKYTDIKEEEDIIRKRNWLKRCADYAENKDPAFVKLLLKLFTERPNKIFTFKLGKLMLGHMDNLLFIEKESKEFKVRKIKKFMWGTKGKNFWYTYIRPDKKKILDLSRF